MRIELGLPRESESRKPILADGSDEKKLRSLMNYAAELELEVDRLRRRDQFLQEEALEHVSALVKCCGEAEEALDPKAAFGTVVELCESFQRLLRDIHELPGYHPSFDQVVAIAVRPLAEQVFRSQQRLNGASNTTLHFELQSDAINWFPARLRHILDNLVSNALRHRDPAKGETRVGLYVHTGDANYELRLTDNGLGISNDKVADMLELFYRAAPTRSAGLGVGLAIAKFLVEQSCGTLSVASTEGQGTCVTVTLPRYDLDDFID